MRLAAVAAFVALAAWPMRDALLRGHVAGAGPDVVVTLWGMWWFAREWAGAAWFGATELVNFPGGATGSVLSPTSAALWALLAPLVGEAVASTLTCVLYLAALMAGVAWLGSLTGLGRPAALLAGVLVLAGRYLVFAVGETSLVGVTALPAILGMGALLRGGRAAASRRAAWLVAYAVCAGLTALEFPYLVPLLPGLGALYALVRRDLPLGVAALAAAGLAALGAMAVGRGQDASFSLDILAAPVRLGPWAWAVVEAEFSRAHLGPLLWPSEVRWSTGGVTSAAATGRDYLGLGVVILATLGGVLRPRAAAPWLGLALLGVALALGSDWGGLPGPFALLNGAARGVVRGLSQPTRYLVLASVGFAIAAAHAADALGRRGAILAIVAFADALAFGGLSLRLPTMELPVPPCVVALRDAPRGGVLAWPWDGKLEGESTFRSRLWQVAHGQPAVGSGVGSWRLLGQPAPTQLQRLGLGEAIVGRGALDTDGLHALGYRWVVADPAPGSWAIETARAALGEPADSCGAEVFAIRPGMPAGRRVVVPSDAVAGAWTR